MNFFSKSILKNLNSCIFFATKTLNFQKHVLVLLDVTTIRVLIDNERIQTCNNHLYEFLKQIHQHKTQLDASLMLTNKSIGSSCNNVFYQQDIDNRDNFPSDKEFLAFKKQRDTFYSILRLVICGDKWVDCRTFGGNILFCPSLCFIVMKGSFINY